MNNKSRKQKGRYLQNMVRDRIFKLFPSLTKDDIRCALMSERGADIKLMSLTSRKLFPYSVETKNREEYKTIFKHWKQTKSHGTLEPLLIIKSNRQRPLAIIDMEHFFNLLDD
jgi:hypothetical protein